jgi:hypothetical protein
LHRKTPAEQGILKRHVTNRVGSRRGVPDDLAEAEILEEIALP